MRHVVDNRRNSTIINVLEILDEKQERRVTTIIKIKSCLECNLSPIGNGVMQNFQSLFIFSHKSDSTITNVCSSVCLSVRQSQNPSTAWNHHPSSFILQHSSFFIHPSFISRLLSFSACLFWRHTLGKMCPFVTRKTFWNPNDFGCSKATSIRHVRCGVVCSLQCFMHSWDCKVASNQVLELIGAVDIEHG